MSRPAAMFSVRHVVVSSISGKNVGNEHWLLVCAEHPESEVSQRMHVCETCWDEGRYRNWRPSAEVEKIVNERQSDDYSS